MGSTSTWFYSMLFATLTILDKLDKLKKTFNINYDDLPIKSEAKKEVPVCLIAHIIDYLESSPSRHKKEAYCETKPNYRNCSF